MATSGTINGTVTGNTLIKSRITWKENSYSVANNTSSVTVSLAYSRDDYQTTYGTGQWKLNINGKTYSGSSYKEISYSWVTVFTQTVTITHDSNGAKTIAINATGSYIPGTSLEGTNCSGNAALTTIPRASTFNSVTGSVAVGSSVTISITAKSADFYHMVTYTCGSASVSHKLGKVGSTSAKTYSHTIPSAWSKQMPSSTSKTASAKIQTYSDSGYKTAVGSALTKNFTVTIPNTAAYKPSVTLAAVLGNATAAGSYYVQGKTKVTLNATNGTANGNATIKSYVFKRESSVISTVSSSGATASASETTATTGTVHYSVTITDSRGRTATATQTITVHQYGPPTITVNKCHRADSTGAECREDGTYIYFQANFAASSIKDGSTEKNPISTAKVQYKKKTESSYGAATNLTSGTGVTLGGGKIEKNAAYDVLITVTDKVGTTVTKATIVPSIFVMMDFKEGGTGVAIGKIAETDYLFDIGMNTTVQNNLRVNGTFSAPKSIVHGRISLTTVAKTPTSVAVHWGEMASNSPHVVATAWSGVPGTQVTEVSVGDRNATGCTIWIYRTTAASMSVDYIAMA